MIVFATKRPATSGDWQEQLAIASMAEFDGDLATVKNVRNFRYYPTEHDKHPDYYDKTYDLGQIRRVWYTTEPFKEKSVTNPSKIYIQPWSAVSSECDQCPAPGDDCLSDDPGDYS